MYENSSFLKGDFTVQAQNEQIAQYELAGLFSVGVFVSIWMGLYLIIQLCSLILRRKVFPISWAFGNIVGILAIFFEIVSLLTPITGLIHTYIVWNHF